LVPPPGSRALPLLATKPLTAEISNLLRRGKDHRELVRIVRRTANAYATSSPSEIVTCLLAGGAKLRVLCKYDVAIKHSSETHRGGVQYEAMVYRDVLANCKSTAPSFYGTFAHPAEGNLCLVIEYVESAFRLSQMSAADGLPLVASWLGAFHRENETAIPLLAQRGELRRYDADYYFAWANRALEMACLFDYSYSWLPMVRDAFAQLIPLLVGTGITIVHGELYPSNVLINRRGVFPVDWESSAIATGALDVATAVEGWPEEEVREFEVVYRRARWPNEPIPSRDETLDAARLYWLLRWLGDRAEWARDDRPERRFESLKQLGLQRGII
jgi:hypothetical protein